jgi:hypothetical protein
MKRLVSVLAIALFLSIPLAANADLVGEGQMVLTYSTAYAVGGDYLLYYGNVTSSTFGYSYNGPIFCISPQPLHSGDFFAFNTLTDPTDTFYSASPTYPTQISLLFKPLSEAAWIADNWKTTLGGSSEALRAQAQLAIWAVLDMTLASGYTASHYLTDTVHWGQASTLYTDAINYNTDHGDYITSHWYAAYDSQDYLTPVPEPGILILLGIAMSAIGISVPFVRKI